MKKMILSLIIVAVTLCSCGVNISDRENDKPESKALYADTIVNTYGTGRIYGNKPARYIDYDTMKTTVLCAKPNCTHTTNECAGVMIGDCPIIYNDYIYYFKYSHKIEETGKGERELKIESKLCRISTATSEEEELVTFTDCEPCDYNGWMIYNDKVFFLANNLNPKEDGYGNIELCDAGGIHFLCSIDLKTKEYKNYGSIYDGDKQYEAASYTSGAQMNGMYQGKIYLNYAFAKDLDVVDEFDYPIFTILMFEFDPETETLTESDLPEAINIDVMNNGTYIYTENGKVVVLNNGEKIVTYIEPGGDSGIREWATCFNNKLFLSRKGVWVDLEDMSEHSMGEYSQDYTAIDYYDGCYILIKGLETVKLTEEELRAL